MKIEIIESTKVGYQMTKEEAIDFSGKEVIAKEYPTIDEKRVEKLAQENARY